MKKIIFLFLLFCIVFPSTTVLADDTSSKSAMVSPTPVAIQYDLPYPGLLPDNPLYTLKAARDIIVAFFISDPLKKATFYLLQSDKRLAASWYMESQNPKNASLLLTTLSKSTNYLSMSVGELRSAKQSGEDSTSTVKKLQESLAKHLSIIQQMMPFSTSSQKQTLLEEEKRLTDIRKEANALGNK